MMKKIVCIAFATLTSISFAQQSQKLLQIDDQIITTDQFKRAYEKNLNLITNTEHKKLDYNIQLYIDYQLKLKEALRLRLDTLPYYKRDVREYKGKLITPFLTSQNTVKKLIEQAYYRTKNRRKASHILIRIPKLTKISDTIIYYNKAEEIRKRLINGEKFEDIALATSEDVSVKNNNGNLGYFEAFQMVYPFENGAYNTVVGKISKPIRTKFGYHIIKPTATKLSKGKVEVGNIVVFDTTKVGYQKIKNAYKKLQSGVDFAKVVQAFSEDKNIKENKLGKLPKFGEGEMLPSIEKQAFSFNKIGEYSKPFSSRFGWHIIKLLAKHPVKSLDSLKSTIKDKLQKSGRIVLANQAVIDSLKNSYDLEINTKALSKLTAKNIDSVSLKDSQSSLLTINNKQIKLKDFIAFTERYRKKNIELIFEKFKENQLLNYYKNQLITQNKNVKNSLQDYSEGLLIYELMKRQIWEKSTNKIGLEAFFQKNKSKYKNKKLKEIRGVVISDYQKELELKLLQKLRSNHQIKIYEVSVEKLKQYYQLEK